MGESKYVYRENIAPQLSQYIGRRFEEIILDVFYLFNSQGLFQSGFQISGDGGIRSRRSIS